MKNVIGMSHPPLLVYNVFVAGTDQGSSTGSSTVRHAEVLAWVAKFQGQGQ